MRTICKYNVILIFIVISVSITPASADNISKRPNDISLENLQFGPHNRWAFSHLRELITTVNISHSTENARTLEGSPQGTDAVNVTWNGESAALSDVLKFHYNDGILVIKDGQVIVEEYYGALTAERPHAMFSMTKSVVAIIAKILEDEGVIDLNKRVKEYVPELANSGYANETLRNLMNMRDGTDYTETYADVNSTVQVSDCAAGFYGGAACPISYPDTVTDVLRVVGRNEGIMNTFVYKSGNTDVISWALEAASGKKISTLISEKLWKPMGATNDANITVDKGGFEFANGGMSATLRDLGKLGLLLLEGGKYGDNQIVPDSFIAELIENKTDKEWILLNPDSNDSIYRSFFWVAGVWEADFYGAGIHGQRLYVSPAENMVIVLLSSWPSAGGDGESHGSLSTKELIGEIISAYK